MAKIQVRNTGWWKTLMHSLYTVNPSVAATKSVTFPLTSQPQLDLHLRIHKIKHASVSPCSIVCMSKRLKTTQMPANRELEKQCTHRMDYYMAQVTGSTDSGTRPPGCESWLLHFLMTWSWPWSLTSVNLDSLFNGRIEQMGALTGHASHVCHEN